MGSKRGAVVVHGGCGRIGRLKSEKEARFRDGLSQAVLAAMKVVTGDGEAIRGVVQAIRILEDEPLFNAGKGGVFAANGTVECDAGIMDGLTGAAGGVSSVKRIKNPITGAEVVMRLSGHTLMCGEGADDFAIKNGCESATQEYFFTERRRRQLISVLSGTKKPELEHDASKSSDIIKGTVGAVVLDRNGHLAAGASTGGLTGKLPGRVSDSSIAGAGFYADTRVAISCTGTGDYFIRAAASKQIADMMRFGGIGLDDACKHIAHVELRAVHAGLIALDSDGNVAMRFNTGGMFRAYMRECDEAPVVKIYK